MKIHKKVIVVTGAGNGIGREIVLNLLKKGAKVAAVDLNETFLNETVKLANVKNTDLSIHVLNITDREAVKNLPEQIIKVHGQIDGLINNAGIIQPFVQINKLEFEDIERVMNVNFYGSLNMIKALLPYFHKRPEAHIVNISSMGGFLPVPGQSIYGASKAAIKLMSEGLYAELMDTNIQVSVVFPGAIGTNIATNSGLTNLPSGDSDTKNSSIKMLPPDKAAEIIVAGIEKNKVRIYVGSDSKIMNFLYRLSPGFATRLIGKKMKSLLPQ
jgi:short-subunit dehydrogenase|tara:strand:- start:27029 stop:27841 length:813 start_codon:yes stop_codon:yes gene_type:complete